MGEGVGEVSGHFPRAIGEIWCGLCHQAFDRQRTQKAKFKRESLFRSPFKSGDSRTGRPVSCGTLGCTARLPVLELHLESHAERSGAFERRSALLYQPGRSLALHFFVVFLSHVPGAALCSGNQLQCLVAPGVRGCHSRVHQWPPGEPFEPKDTPLVSEGQRRGPGRAPGSSRIILVPLRPVFRSWAPEF